MNITARPYQIKCVNAMFQSMLGGREFGLVAIPTGGGKTIIFSLFIQEVYRRYARQGRRIRVAVISHREQLVSQSRDKLLRVWPESAPKIGLACASMNKDVDINSEIIIGSIQTLTNRMRNRTIEPFNIILVDEAHRIPHQGNQTSQYAQLIRVSSQLRPERKIFGFTATPYQLGHGYIYGDFCRPDRMNWFTDLTFSLTMDEMIRDGYLVPYRIKEAVDIGPDLRSVPIVNGEYKADMLGSVMCRFSETAYNAWLEHGEGRRKTVLFCANIAHAEHVARTFRSHGLSACAVHSKIPDRERKERLDAFSRGEVNFLSSVDALSEGWDETGIDCVLMLRPTKSPMVYVQQCGRGMRPHEGKKDLLVLDMADNVREHGFFSSPRIIIPGSPKEGGEAPVKICPGLLPNGAVCGLALHASVMICPECGHVFPKRQYKEPGRLKFRELSREKGDYSLAYPVGARIKSVELERRDRYTAILFHYRDNHGKDGVVRYFVNNWMPGSRAWRDEWEKLTGLESYPESMDELEDFLPEAQWPEFVFINKQNERRYSNISWFVMNDGEKYEPGRWRRSAPAEPVARRRPERAVFDGPEMLPLGGAPRARSAEKSANGRKRGMMIEVHR